MTESKWWYLAQIDRCIHTGFLNSGYRLVRENQEDTYITGVSYQNNLLKVKDSYGKIINLTTEPNNNKFIDTLYKEWEEWDKETFINNNNIDDEDRYDYKPYALKSLEAAALSLNLINNPDMIESVFIKDPNDLKK